MTQADFAAIGGLNLRTQIRYEQNDGTPDGAYLRALAKVGVDVQYVLTGVRTISVVTDDEQELLSLYRSLDYYGKGGVWGMIKGLISAQPGQANKKAGHH